MTTFNPRTSIFDSTSATEMSMDDLMRAALGLPFGPNCQLHTIISEISAGEETAEAIDSKLPVALLQASGGWLWTPEGRTGWRTGAC